MDVLLRRGRNSLGNLGNNPLSLGAVDHQRQEFGATVCIPGYTNLGNHGGSVKRAGEIDITHFLLHKLSRLGTSGQDSSHTKEKNSVSQVATGPQNGGQINHPARHGEESPASVVGGGQTKRVVGGEREREKRALKGIGGRLMALDRGRSGGLAEGSELMCGLVRQRDDKTTTRGSLTAPQAAVENNKKASVAKAIKIAKSPGFTRVLGSFRRRFHAASARASRDCKRSEVLKLAKEVAGETRVLPLSRATVEGVAAALKEAGMKAGTQYLTELKLLHVEAGFEIEAWLKRTMDQCSTRAVEVRVETWAADKVLTKSVRKGSPKNVGLMFLWAAVWMLREIEARNMKIRDVLRHDKEKWAAIWLPTSKGDQQGVGGQKNSELLRQEPVRHLLPMEFGDQGDDFGRRPFGCVGGLPVQRCQRQTHHQTGGD